MVVKLNGGFVTIRQNGIKFFRKEKTMASKKADEMLFWAETAKETKKALQMGANVNATPSYVWGTFPSSDTALIVARTAEQTKLLLEAGADVNAIGWHGRTALTSAQTAEQTKLLLEAGADVNAREDDIPGMYVGEVEYGRTALIKAKTAEQTKLLLEAGAKVNIRAGLNKCETALRNADSVEQALLLIRAGADKKDLEKNKFLSKKDMVKILESLQKDKEIKAQINQAKERLKNKPRLKGVSGVVIADEIAKKQISGEEKRVVTPGVGKELRQEIMKNLKKQVKE